MRELKRVAKRRHNGQRFGSEFFRAQQLAKIHSVNEFHEQKIKAAGLSEVVDRDDARMVQPRERLRFALETLGKACVIRALRRENLQRDETIELWLPHFEDRAHSARADE